MTRETDETLQLEQRVDFANANNADLFVSIHVNWIEPVKSARWKLTTSALPTTRL